MGKMKQTKSPKGSILTTVLFVMILLMSLILGVLMVASANLHRARGRILLLQAQYAAESGADVAIAKLNANDTAYMGEASDVQLLNATNYRSTFTSTISPGANEKEKIITATGKIYSPKSQTTPRYTRTIRVAANRTSSMSAASMMSRNIVHVGSAVKNVVAKDVFLNGYLQADKNTNTLTFENVTVAGKRPTAANCSISGAGSLEKPSTFKTPGQTKTKLRLAFSNCISPPGNTPNTNFDVAVNQTDISPIQSMYIPWNQFMNATYSNADNCSDWTTGGSPRAIPSLAGSKKTHYPNAGSNTVSTCGTNGDISLGSNTYTITDHVHIRADLCRQSGCSPTFNNPDTGESGVKYVFVEGAINFNSINTPTTSGPIVFVTYGADPPSKAGDCPHGGSLYLGSDGSTSTYAPNVYLLAMNGLCLDKTKFAKSGLSSTTGGLPTPALGGLGGKNIYIATNSGSPWDLALDPNFPTSAIPIDLAWRQSSYERL